ncbi:MAG: tetratricopeptide repeat protein [Lentisphaerae bacterium]|nr:tetratricopeptide repeat protein [Lentisphaerota bacterium]
MLLVAAGCLAYANSFRVPFMRDDIAAIEQNPSIVRLWPLTAVLNAPGQGNTTYARPILNLSFALNRAAFGHSPASYHAVNLAIHILNALLLFGLAGRLLRRLSVDTAIAPFAIALLWMLHPLQTESITYMVQRAEALATLFYLLTLYALGRASEPVLPSTAPWRRPRRLWSCLAVCSCALGMATKEILVTAPFVALAFDRIFWSHSWRDLWRQRGPLHLALFATLGIQGALLATYGRIGHDAALTAGRATPWQYLLTQTGVIAHYLRLAFWPRALVFDYFDWPIAHRVGDVWPTLLFILGLALATLYALARHPRLGFLGLCFFALLAPTSSILPIPDIAVEHRMYLPLAALTALAVMSIRNLVIRIQKRYPANPRLKLITGHGSRITVLCLAVALGTLTHLRNRDYADDLTIATDTLRKRPASARAHYDMGIALLSLGDASRALPFFDRAAELKPDYGMAYFGRAESLTRLGRHADALPAYTRAYELAPQYFFILNNRGAALLALGRARDALPDFDATLARAASYGPAYLNRGRAFAVLGQSQAALRDLERAAHLLPANAAPWVEYGNVLAALGNFRQAADAFTRALQRAPSDPDIYYNRANARAQDQDPFGAMQDFHAALQLAPGMAKAYNNRAALHYTLGQWEQARTDIESCRRLGVEPSSNLVALVDSARTNRPAESH